MAARRSPGPRCTSMVGGMTVSMGSLSCGRSERGTRVVPTRLSGVAGESEPGDRPAGGRGEEIAIGRTDVVGRRQVRATAQDVLVDHELAVVLADGTGGRREPGVGAVGRRGPLPHVAERWRVPPGDGGGVQ